MIHDSIWVGAHFQAIEFRCNCGCGENEIHQGVIHVLEEVRKVVGVPLRVSSGVRWFTSTTGEISESPGIAQQQNLIGQDFKVDPAGNIPYAVI